jgi:hypothetical protein
MDFTAGDNGGGSNAAVVAIFVIFLIIVAAALFFFLSSPSAGVAKFLLFCSCYGLISFVLPMRQLEEPHTSG